jgi:hypothetical protein
MIAESFQARSLKPEKFDSSFLQRFEICARALYAR